MKFHGFTIASWNCPRIRKEHEYFQNLYIYIYECMEKIKSVQLAGAQSRQPSMILIKLYQSPPLPCMLIPHYFLMTPQLPP